MMKHFILGLAAAIGLSGLATAQQTNIIKDELLVTRLIAEGPAQPGETTRLALDMIIEPGWHTYWVNAGDSGDAVAIDWTLPEGVSVSEVHWPAPHRQPYPPLMNYGYSDRATLLMDMSLPADWPADKPVELKAGLFWLICAEVCIPGEGALSLSVPTQGAPDPAAAAIFAQADEHQPMPSPYQAKYETTDTSVRLLLEGEDFADAQIQDAYFFPAEWGVIDHAAKQNFVVGSNGLSFDIARSPETDDPYEGESLGGVVEITRAGADGPVTTTLAIDAAGNTGAALSAGAAGIGALGGAAAAAAAGGAGSFASGSFPLILGFAFLGGLLLNLMPCVFPVLALKAVGIAQTAHAGGRERLSHGLAYAAGVLVLFAVLGGALIALKGAGASIGWGFQLQNPIIVAVLAYVMLLVGLNLSGFFDVTTGLEGIGSEAAASGGKRGAFFTGALAAIVATPCSAPFMATAIGAALTMSAPKTMAVFLMLGLGLAAPMILLGLFPGLARRFPKPGVWMVRLKEALAFPMYITAAWLVWVLGSLSGQNAMLIAMVGGVLIAFAAWAFSRARGSAGKMRLVGYAAGALALIVVGVASASFKSDGKPSAAMADAGSYSEPFTTARLASLRAAGTPVFINMTADWCITCKVNERVALGPAFEAELKEKGVAYLVGDWTAYDAQITALLEEFGRAGVPLYALYNAQGEAELLPQILTPGMLSEKLAAL